MAVEGSASGVPSRDGYSRQVLPELPPQAGKPVSEGVEALWESGQISACSFRRPQEGLGLGAPIFPAWLGSTSAHLERIPSGLRLQRWPVSGSGNGAEPLPTAGPEPWQPLGGKGGAEPHQEEREPPCPPSVCRGEVAFGRGRLSHRGPGAPGSTSTLGRRGLGSTTHTGRPRQQPAAPAPTNNCWSRGWGWAGVTPGSRACPQLPPYLGSPSQRGVQPQGVEGAPTAPPFPGAGLHAGLRSLPAPVAGPASPPCGAGEQLGLGTDTEPGAAGPWGSRAHPPA